MLNHRSHGSPLLKIRVTATDLQGITEKVIKTWSKREGRLARLFNRRTQ